MGASRGLQDNIPSIVRGSSTTVTLAATNNGQPTRITVGGQQYNVTSGLTMTTSTSGFQGLDTGSIAANTLYYVYAVVSSSVVGLVASVTAPTTGPTGFANRYKLLGRFRTDFGGTSVNTVAADASIRPTPALEFLDSIGTFTLVNNGSKTFTITSKSWRRGELLVTDLYLDGNATASGGTGSVFEIVLPTGYNFYASGLPDAIGGGGNNIGTYFELGVFAASQYSKHKPVIPSSGNRLGLLVSDSAQVYVQNGDLNFARNMDFAIHFEAPIAEWAGLYT